MKKSAIRSARLKYQKQRIENDSNIKKVPLSQGQFALVDEEDYEEIMKYKWIYNAGFAARSGKTESGKTTTIIMHREIMNNPEGMVVFHRNGNSIDNRKINLAVCSRSEFEHSVRKRNPKSKMTGVKRTTCSKGKFEYWKAYLSYSENGEKKYRSKCFPFTEEGKIQAARWYNEEAVKKYGKQARINKL
jgi:hypothetical protein